MLHIAIGPELPQSSWDWVGFDLTRELSKYFEVEVFRGTVPACDVALAVKQLPSRWSTRLIYFPIDHYPHRQAIERDAHLLRNCTAIGCHSKRLMTFFEPLCKHVFYLDHHVRYRLIEPAPYKKEGYVLWVGAIQYVPYVLKWNQLYPLGTRLVILTNPWDSAGMAQARGLAARLRVMMHFGQNELNGHRLCVWSELRQLELMQEAKAAIDIKGGRWLGEDDWSQRMKPATKSQKFVSSAIPFAANPDSFCFEYFESRGFHLANPSDASRWFSYEYWQETFQQALALRAELSLESIGCLVKSIIEQVMVCVPPTARWLRQGGGCR